MKMQNILNYLSPDDFVIIVRPVKEEEDSAADWTGEVQVSIVSNTKDTTLNKEAYDSMLMLCNFAAASIPAMEENVFIRDVIEGYVEQHMTIVGDEVSTVVDVLTADTDTEGSA